MSITRILKLAEIYGPFARFFPEGNEAVDDALKDAENADLKDNAEFDKVRQQADQEKANAARARETAEAATSQLNEANSQVDDLKAQLAEANAKAETAGIDIELDEEDYSDGDVAIVKSIKALNKKIDAKDVEITSLKKDAKDSKAKDAVKEASAQQEAQYQGLLDDMDEDYGPEYRNAAVTAFEALRAAGKVTGGPAKATRMLEKCYRDAVKAKATKEKDAAKNGVRLDTGSGGGDGIGYSGVELKAGSLEDVTAQAGKLLNKSG